MVNSNDTSGAEFDQFPSPSNFHQRPDLVPGQAIVNSNWVFGSRIRSGISTEMHFADPALGTFGSLGRNAIYGPHFRNMDFAVTKFTPITDRVGLQLRVEFFNIFNHPQFCAAEFLCEPGDSKSRVDHANSGPGADQSGAGWGRAEGDSGGGEVFVLGALDLRVKSKSPPLRLRSGQALAYKR